MKYSHICGALLVISLLWACKSTEKIPPLNYELLYQTWGVDSVRMTDKELPFAHWFNTTMEFTKEGEIITGSRGNITRTPFILKERAIIDKNNPEQAPHFIEKLTEESLILLGTMQEETELRLFLSPK